MTDALCFNTDYLEELTLHDGDSIQLRLIRPSDKRNLLKAFNNLSALSRFKRFLGFKKQLAESELRYFTEVDQINHFALLALEPKPGAHREAEGIGIARFVRLEDDPECAEVALSVIDRMQQRGIGRILLEKLIAAALERNIKRLRFECLGQNLESQKLVRKLCQVVEYERSGGIISAEVTLPVTDPAAPQSSLLVINSFMELMRAFASDTLQLQTSLGTDWLVHMIDNALQTDNSNDLS